MSELKAGRLFRDMPSAEIKVDVRSDGPTRLSFPASSGAPVDRWFGTEVLSHEDGAIRMQRMNAGAAPLLFNHDWADPVGMIDGARIQDGRLVVDAHLFSTARAQDVKAMVQDGLRNVSIGYQLHEVEEPKKGSTIFTARDWEPLEVSIVTVPADPSVGIGRSDDDTAQVVRVRSNDARERANPAEPATTTGATMAEVSNAPAGGTAESQTAVVTFDPVAEAGRRRTAIQNLAKAVGIPDERAVDSWVRSDKGYDEISVQMLKYKEELCKQSPQAETAIGLSSKELRKYSLSRAIHACADKSWKRAGLELEASQAIAQKLNLQADEYNFYVPFEVQQREHQVPADMARYGLGRRDLTVGTAGAGGYLVETQNLGFIELLRNRSVAMNMGARRLSGLTGSVTVPRQSAAATGYWLSTEATQITESQQTFVQMALTPKTVGAYTEISRQLLLQSSPDAESIVTTDLATVCALAVDSAVLNGSGASGQPTGIINTAGIGSVTGTSLAYAGIIEFQTDVAAANVMGTGYVTTPAVAGLLKARVKFSSTASPLWDGRLEDAIVDGYRGMSSNQVPTANMLYGDWTQVVIAEWGVLEIAVNPQANFQAGIIGVRAMYSVDVGVRYPAAFSLATSIT